MLMCGRHWRLVPYPLKRAVWRHYQDGQERLDGTSPRPTPEYLAAAEAAIDAVERVEQGGRTTPRAPSLFDT